MGFEQGSPMVDTVIDLLLRKNNIFSQIYIHITIKTLLPYTNGGLGVKWKLWVAQMKSFFEIIFDIDPFKLVNKMQSKVRQ